MKSIALLSICFLFIITTEAQVYYSKPETFFYKLSPGPEFKTSLSISTSTFSIPNELAGSKLNNQYELSISRKIYKNFGFGIGYSFWNKANRLGGYNDYCVNVPYYGDSSKERGSLSDRMGYKFIDLLINYERKITQRQYLKIGLGYSYAWGTNRYLTDFTVNPEPPYDAFFTYKNVPADYHGAIGKLTYEYRFFKNRLGVGADFSYRLFFSAFQQYNFGLHTGFNF